MVYGFNGHFAPPSRSNLPLKPLQFRCRSVEEGVAQITSYHESIVRKRTKARNRRVIVAAENVKIV